MTIKQTLKKVLKEASEPKLPLTMKNIDGEFSFKNNSLVLKCRGVELIINNLRIVNNLISDTSSERAPMYDRIQDNGTLLYDGVKYKIKRVTFPGYSSGGRYYGREFFVSTKENFYFTFVGKLEKMEEIFEKHFIDVEKIKAKVMFSTISASKS